MKLSSNRVTSPEWGPWVLNIRLRTLSAAVYPHNQRYEIGLDSWCTSDAGALHLIFHVARKKWATPEVAAGLVNAIQDIVGCGYNGNEQRTVSDIAEGCRRIPAELRRRELWDEFESLKSAEATAKGEPMFAINFGEAEDYIAAHI